MRYGGYLGDRRSIERDTSEFAQFIKARSQALQRTAWLLTGDWGLAEDLVQTALARSWPR
jgi:DNA-directed RNA polymerase specialized sigma24 family protein